MRILAFLRCVATWAVCCAVPLPIRVAHSANLVPMLLQNADATVAAHCWRAMGPAAGTHLNFGASLCLCTSVPMSEHHSPFAASIHCSAARAMSALLWPIPTGKTAIGFGRGPCGMVAGILVGLASCLIECLLASPCSKSLAGQCGCKPASSILITAATAGTSPSATTKKS